MVAKVKRIDKTQTDLQTEKNLKLLERFTLVSDGDGHEFVIPVSQLKTFESWLEMDPESEDFDCERFNDFRIDGGLLTFTDPAVN